MIHDVDDTLSDIVKRDVLNGSNVEISFDAPSRDWAARRTSPALNFYLYDITEDLTRRDVMVREVRDDEGRVLSRKLPEKKFRLAYLVTAWTQRPLDEHRLLSAVLTCFLRFEALPSDTLRGSLTNAASPIRVTVGLPLPKDRQLSDIWSALGGELKPSLDLVITAPFAVGRTFQIGPLVTESPVVEITSQLGQKEKVAEVAGEDGVSRIRRLAE